MLFDVEVVLIPNAFLILSIKNTKYSNKVSPPLERCDNPNIPRRVKIEYLSIDFKANNI